MKCIISPFNICYKNIASEEYYLSKFDDDLFYLYINSPSIIVGRHQNTYSEINQEYTKEHNIDVVRRQSGGGAVYHDLGNLNYGFITKSKGLDINEVFRQLSQPIVHVLQMLGADAKFSGRNDLVIDDKKISGIAQYHTRDKVLLHGTLLFDSDMSQVSASLNVDPRKFQDKSVKSVKSRVTNIKPYLTELITIDQFASTIVANIIDQFPGSSMYDLSREDMEEIEKLAATKYSTWQWVYGNSPKFTYQHALKYEKGILDFGLHVESGIIEDIIIYGDFFSKKDMNDLYDLLRKLPYDPIAVTAALEHVTLDDYLFGLSKEQFIEGLFTNSPE